MKHLKNILVPLFVTLTLGCNNNDKINQKVEFTPAGARLCLVPFNNQ